jgi:mono/diheme cytochrome c family protein
MTVTSHMFFAPVALIASVSLSQPVLANAGHSEEGEDKSMVEQMREEHDSHEHGHDFEALEAMSPEQQERTIALMREVGIVLPHMDPARGRELFLQKGCIACHSINGVGGEIGPSLNSVDMPSSMSVFDFSARMWRGAGAMTSMQQDLLGDVINLTGQDLADLTAFAHDDAEQKKLSDDQIPEKFQEFLDQ